MSNTTNQQQWLSNSVDDEVPAPKLDVLCEFIKQRLGLVKKEDIIEKHLKKYSEFSHLAKLTPREREDVE